MIRMSSSKEGSGNEVSLFASGVCTDHDTPSVQVDHVPNALTIPRAHSNHPGSPTPADHADVASPPAAQATPTVPPANSDHPGSPTSTDHDTASPPAARTVSTVNLSSETMAWFGPWVTYLERVSTEDIWQLLVLQLVAYEALEPSYGVSVHYFCCRLIFN
jgi:hypothetical protein